VAEPIPLPTPQQIVTIRALMIPLMRGAGLVVVLGLIFAVDAFTRALFGTVAGGVGWIPFVGRVVAAPIHRIEQKLSNYLGGLESHIDVSMGGYIHALATGVGQLASGEAEAGWAAWLIAKVVHATRVAVDALPATGTVTGKITKVYKITKTYPRYVTNVYKIAAHAAPGALVGTVRAIAGTLDDVVTWDIPRLWKRTRAIENSLDRVWHRIRAEKKIVVGTAFAGAVAVALGRMGLGWLRCNSFKNLGKRIGCRGFGLLETLLAATIEVLLIADVCQITKLMIRVAESRPVREALSGIIAATDELLLCQGVERAPDMEFHAVALPPAQRWATLPG
jgi:hypothetical protein